MSETCNIETGLLRKKPCGATAVTHCATCEQPLCAQHALPQLAAGKKTGKFLCKECETAEKDYDKEAAKKEKQKREAEMMNSLKNPAAPKPKGAAPAAPPPPPPAPAKPPAAGAPAATAKPAPAPAADAPLEFTPSKPKPADDAPLEFTPGDKTKK